MSPNEASVPLMSERRLRHAYKEVRLQQLRSFCETARVGSMAAAAASLGVAQPTVWEQVHALERDFKAKLVEPHGRGCRLTADGRVLVELAGPLVTGMDVLKRQFHETRAKVEIPLALATTPRILVEDLPACVVAFERRWPQVSLTLKEVSVEQVSAEVESGAADLGLITYPDPRPPSPWLVFEPCYQLDVILVTPRDHPLARRRRILPQQLRAFPLVNAPTALPDPAVRASLDKLGLFQTKPRRVEAFYHAAIYRYVQMGFGIGLIYGSRLHKPRRTLHERTMSRYFGKTTIYLVWRKGALQHEAVRAFADTVKTMLKGP